MKTRWSAAAVAAAAAALLCSACAEEREPLSWVQPNALDKSFFVGEDLDDPADDPEFYSQATVVDVGYGATGTGLVTSSYGQKVARVKWAIQEDVLVARLTFEQVEDSDHKGAGPASTDGLVVGAWPITSHFDIQRQYNPSTGEELNVVVENTTDRPWSQRRFFRVDWSKNLEVTNYDFDTLSMLGLWGVDYEPLAYSITDPNHPDAPHFDLDDGYFDVTNKAFAKPGTVRFSWGEYPVCMLPTEWGGGANRSCGPTEITVRHSFRRVGPSDYEPQHWDGERFAAYGAFTTDRKGYARNYGMTDDRWHRLINRYDIWERSHFYADPIHMTGEVSCYTPETTPAGADPHRDEDGDGTEDECAAVGNGSRCDEFRQRCTLPYRDRTAKPVVWYFTSGSDLDYFEGTLWAAHEWDVALRSAVQTARYAECVHTHGTDCAARYPVLTGQDVDQQDAIWLAREIDSCRAEGRTDCDERIGTIAEVHGFSPGVVALARMDEMVVLCHSPVEHGDPAACGGPRLPPDVTARDCADAQDEALLATCRTAREARRGDLRYHQISAIQEPQNDSPWGLMVDANDPMTGETISASINVWTAVSDLWSQSVIDVARYVRGELATEEITNGEYVRAWGEAANAAASRGMLPTMTREQRLRSLADLAGTSFERLQAMEQSGAFTDATSRARAADLERELTSTRADAKAFSANAPIYDARRRQAMGSSVEAQLFTPMMQQLAGDLAGADLEAALQVASPFRGANPAFARELKQRRELALADRGACVLENGAMAPFGIPALARILEEKFGAFDAHDSKASQLARAEKMRRYVAQRAHYAVVAHEMGHSMGLRHNFVGSADAFSYRPQYWQLRTGDGTATTACDDLDPSGACVGPRYFDPITDNERDNLIQMFMHSTVMDYAGESTQDLLGLGVYDFAAVRMFYGNAVAVEADPSFSIRTPKGTGLLVKMDSFGGTVGLRPTIGTADDPTLPETFHYSQLQNRYGLIHDCREIDPDLLQPVIWDEAKWGAFSPLLDGLTVQVGGKYTRCRQNEVDFVAWSDLRKPKTRADVRPSQAEVAWSFGGPSVDRQGRIRVPYGYASDRWADLGNLSVYRHDNGADPYELFDFLITQQEVNHIFTDYRRNRTNFSVRGAAFGTLERYNTKLRDAAKGLGLTANLAKDEALAYGYDPEAWWSFLSSRFWGDNVLASGIAFDHFARQLARPQAGPHYLPTRGSGPSTTIDELVLRSEEDAVGDVGTTRVTIPNGATGLYGNVSFGGKPVGNAYADSQGEYDTDFVMNAGSYYDKAFTAYLMTESYDNFVSDSRGDFTDARYRSVSLADLYPDGFRRWLGNNLTGDEEIKGVRVAADGTRPLKDADGYPAAGIGWTSWWPKEGPEVCFPSEGTLLCSAETAESIAVDPQVGWEQQKFLIAWTLWYLPENQKQAWLDQLSLWQLGADADPGFANRIEFHDPHGKVYVARTFGRETIFGKTVQKGIAARVLEYANELTQKAYATEAVDGDGDGTTDWYVPVPGANGQPIVRYDPAILSLDEEGQLHQGRPGCNAEDESGCTCSMNRACAALEKYSEVPFFLREAIAAYGLGAPWMK